MCTIRRSFEVIACPRRLRVSPNQEILSAAAECPFWVSPSVPTLSDSGLRASRARLRIGGLRGGFWYDSPNSLGYFRRMTANNATIPKTETNAAKIRAKERGHSVLFSWTVAETYAGSSASSADAVPRLPSWNTSTSEGSSLRCYDERLAGGPGTETNRDVRELLIMSFWGWF
jgi:hypothetical protein